MSTASALRVLFVESQTEVGGAQMALLNLLAGLDRAEVEPFCASLGFGAGDLPARVEALDIPVFRLPAGRFRELRRTSAKLRALVHLIRAEHIDVVVSNSGHPLLFARPAALWTRRPCVWWVHGYFPHDPLRGHAIALAQQMLSADALFANSEYTARVLRQEFQNGASIRVARIGCDLERFRPDAEAGAAARRALGIAGDAPVAGMFGRLHPFKGQEVFLRAAAQLAPRYPQCRFVLVGGTPFELELAYAENLRRMAGESNLEKQVMFLGQRDDVNQLLNACDFVVHASVEPEPWGIVIAEAMAAGRAVIAAAAGGPLEMIEHGRTGLLVPPNDAAQLAAAIELLLNRPEERRRLGAAARAHAEQNFDRCRAAAVFTAELRRACSAYRARG